MADETSSLTDLGVSANRPIFPYDVTAQLNSLPLYDTCEGLDSQLDQARELILSNNYYYQGVPVPVIPDGQLWSIDSYATFSGTVTVPAYTFLVALTHYTNQPEGFKIKIYDKGAKTDIFYNGFAKDVTASSPMGVTGPIVGTSSQVKEIQQALAPRWITSPMIVLPPGTLQIEIVNLSPNQNLIQVCFHFAIPFGGKATNIVSIGS